MLEDFKRALRNVTVGDVVGCLSLFLAAYIGMIWVGVAV